MLTQLSIAVSTGVLGAAVISFSLVRAWVFAKSLIR